MKSKVNVDFNTLKDDRADERASRHNVFNRPSIRRILPDELKHLFKSKEDMYKVFSVEGKVLTLNNLGQFHMPPIDECTIDFMRDVFAGRKFVSSTILSVAIVPQELRSQAGDCA